MSEQSTPPKDALRMNDELALFVGQVEDHVRDDNIAAAAELIEANVPSAWFGLDPFRTVEIVQLILATLDSPALLFKAGMGILTASSAGQFDSHHYLSGLNSTDSHDMFMLSMFRMTDLRLHGHTVEALEQGDNLEKYLGNMGLLHDPQDGWELHTTVQIGITAMMAGDFTRALTAFTRAQMLALVPKYAFLTRDALVKSALIHACFGNATTARSLLLRADRITRTSSWIERHIDAHHDFAALLISDASHDEALDRLEAMSLHDIGEMWPFYIIAVHRLLEADGHHDELDHRLEMFDTLPFASIDREGFSGSVIPLKRAMLTMKAGRSAEAQRFLDRADPRLPYTHLVEAAGHAYAGRTQQALQQAAHLKHDTRGYRLLEIRRLSILAAAQYQAEAIDDCLETLAKAATIPRGLTPAEVELFSPETRELAVERIDNWPQDSGGPSAFLTGLPRPGCALTDREIEIIEQLAQGHRRADIASNLFISVNTLKSQLQSIYRKLDVSTAADAVVGAQRRGLI